MKTYQVSEAEAGERADVFVAKKYPEFARSALTNLFVSSDIEVNGKPSKAGYKLKDGDTLSINTKKLTLVPTKISMPVIYEDSDVLVVNKPAGVLSHGKGGISIEPSVASFLRSKLKLNFAGGDRVGIVHRLDRATSGVMICAKNQKTLTYLQKQFANRETKKIYLALVEGKLEQKKGLIDVPIARNPKNPKLFRASASGKPSQTEFCELSSSHDQTLVELSPKTGRTHQLRVHMSYIGHPIAGDDYYGPSKLPNLKLHAWKLKIQLPSGQNKEFKAQLPTWAEGRL